ncbi:MAG: dCTP deaminase [bacterium]|nr:dCTP deaminase [bacterium]
MKKTRDPLTIYGTLPDWVIKEFLRRNIIKIEPLPKDLDATVDEVTIDFTLGHTVRVFRRTRYSTIDLHYTTKTQIDEMMETITLADGQPFVLEAGDFAIATTTERLILPDDIVGRLDGKSSLARLGVVVHSTAARFDPGWDGKPVLEFGTFLPDMRVILYQGDPVCAFTFERLQSPVHRSYKENPNRKYGSDIPDVSAYASDKRVRKKRK